MKTRCCEDETVFLHPLPPNGSFKSFQFNYVSSVSYNNIVRLLTTDILAVLKSGVCASSRACSSLRYTHAIPTQGTSLHSWEKPAKKSGCETQQYIMRHKISTLSSEIHIELFTSMWSLFEDEIRTIIYSKSKVATLWTVNLLWINTGINKARVFSVELFQFIAPGDFSACISSEGINQ